MRDGMICDGMMYNEIICDEICDEMSKNNSDSCTEYCVPQTFADFENDENRIVPNHNDKMYILPLSDNIDLKVMQMWSSAFFGVPTPVLDAWALIDDGLLQPPGEDFAYPVASNGGRSVLNQNMMCAE